MIDESGMEETDEDLPLEKIGRQKLKTVVD